jgi:hypothetical protein
MISRVFFAAEVDGGPRTNAHVDLKQTVGSDYETGSIEVSPPVGYSGPLNYNVFREEVTRYYRGLVGSGGSGIRIVGASNIRMRNNEFRRQVAFEFDAERAGSS